MGRFGARLVCVLFVAAALPPAAATPAHAAVAVAAAVDGERVEHGMCAGFATVERATACAVAQCRARSGGGDCKPLVSCDEAEGGWAALSFSAVGRHLSLFCGAATSEEAAAAARAQCEARVGQADCTVVREVYDDPLSVADDGSAAPRTEPAGQASDAVEPGSAAYEAAETVNLRAAPDNEGEVIGRIEKGHAVAVTGISADGFWYRARTRDGVEGYVFRDFLRANGETALPAGDGAMSEAACSRLHAALEAAGEVPLSAKLSGWRDERRDRLWNACRLRAPALPASLTFGGLADRYRTLLSGMGWRERADYNADGPSGTRFALGDEAGTVCVLGLASDREMAVDIACYRD